MLLKFSFISSIMFVILLTNSIIGQGVNNLNVSEGKSDHKKGLVELETSLIGPGVTWFWNHDRFSQGMGINLICLNYTIYTNDEGFKDYLAIHGFVHQLSYIDILKIKYSLKTVIAKPINFGISPYFCLSNVPMLGEEADLSQSIGLEYEINYFTKKRVGLSTSFAISKNINNSHLYVLWIPIKILIKFNYEKA